MKSTPPSTRIVIKGLPEEQEARVRAAIDKITIGPSMFASSVGTRLVPTEVEVFRRAKDGKMQARMVYETTVEEGASAVRSCPGAGEVLERRAMKRDGRGLT